MMPYGPNQRSFASASQAATFVDYGNLHSVLAAQTDATRPPSTFVAEILREVRRYLEEGDDTPTVLGRAYADFGTLLDGRAPTLLQDLDRDGFQPVFASSEVQANAAELRLTMDVTDALNTQPHLDTIVIVTGNRPYLPLVRRIRERGGRALVAIVNPPRPDNGLPKGDADVYLDARNLLSRSSREALLQNGSSNGTTTQDASSSAATPLYRPLTRSISRRTIEITEEYFGQYDEVYLTPLLRKLSDVLGDAHDPKALVSELEAAGAVRLEKRDGYPYDYTVLIVNDEHPSVQEIHDDYYTGRSPFTYDEIAGTQSDSDGSSSETYDPSTTDPSGDGSAPSDEAPAHDEPALSSAYDESSSDEDTVAGAEAGEAAAAPDDDARERDTWTDDTWDDSALPSESVSADASGEASDDASSEPSLADEAARADDTP